MKALRGLISRRAMPIALACIITGCALMAHSSPHWQLWLGIGVFWFGIGVAVAHFERLS